MNFCPSYKPSIWLDFWQDVSSSDKYLTSKTREWCINVCSRVGAILLPSSVNNKMSTYSRIGRKKSMMIGLFFEMVFALAATFTPIYELYVVLRFLVGACVAGSFTSMFVLCEYNFIGSTFLHSKEFTNGHQSGTADIQQHQRFCRFYRIHLGKTRLPY